MGVLFLKKGVLIVIISILVVILIASFLIYDSASNFQGPEYIPANFQLVKNTTNENASVLVYNIPNKMPFFVVAAVKDSNKVVLNNITSSMNSVKLSTNNSNVITSNESITIENHQTELHTETISLLGVGISFFDVTWHCNNGLTLLSFGLVASSQMSEMKNMLVSIKCHKYIFF